MELCLENPARIDDLTIQALRTELGRIVEASGRSAAWVPCRPGAVRIVLRHEPPDEETSALASGARSPVSPCMNWAIISAEARAMLVTP